MSFGVIKASGGDTGTPLSLQKRMAIFPHNHIALDQQRVIDCGCGTGQYVMEFLRQGADAYGVEYEMRKVTQFQQKHPEHAFRVKQGDIEAMDFPDTSYDVALLNEVLEHVPHEQKALSEVFRLLKPGGYLVVFSPNRYYPFESHGVYWKGSKKKLPVYIPFIPYIPVNVGKNFFDYWARNYWPRELQSMVHVTGFQILHTDYFWQTFENISGQQPLPIRLLRTPIRGLATTLERTPLVKSFGVTQAVIAQKPLSPK